MSLTYTRDIPDPPSSPSVDVPNMKVNTNSIDDIWRKDHFSFSSATAGLHNRVQLVEIGTALPAGLANVGSGTLFTKVTANPFEGNLYFYRIGAGAAIQMTGPGSPLAAGNGYTFLPGGFLMQWGTVPAGIVVGNNPISFNITFPNNVYNIMISTINGAANIVLTINPAGSTTSGFVVVSNVFGTR